MKRTSLLAAIAALSFTTAQGALLVTDIRGAATIEGKGGVTMLAEIADGSRLSLDAGAKLVAVDLATGKEFELAGGKRYFVAPAGPETADGQRVAPRSLPVGNLPAVKVSLERVAQATLVMRGYKASNVPTPVFPASTVLLETRPHLSWEPVDGAKQYHVTVTLGSGRAVWDFTTAATEAPWGGDHALDAGAKYRWRVEALNDLGRMSSADASFTIAAEDVQRRLAALKPGDGDSFARRVLYAAQLRAAGANEVARREWQALAQERPDDPLIEALAK